MTEEVLLTGPEIAAIFKVSPSSVRRWAREGLLKVAAVTPGGRRRYRQADVDKLLAPKDEPA